MHNSMWLGRQTVSSLERCPLFRVSFIERFHCAYIHTHIHMYTCTDRYAHTAIRTYQRPVDESKCITVPHSVHCVCHYSTAALSVTECRGCVTSPSCTPCAGGVCLQQCPGEGGRGHPRPPSGRSTAGSGRKGGGGSVCQYVKRNVEIESLHCSLFQTTVLALREQYTKEEEHPFNSEQKWMAVRVRAAQCQVSWAGAARLGLCDSV